MSTGQHGDGYSLDIGDADERHAPRGEAHYLHEAVDLLLDDDAPPAELRSAERVVIQLATDFNAGMKRYAQGGRLKAVAAQLRTIEEACAGLVQAFDGASCEAYDVLHGYGGPGGLSLSLHGMAESVRYAALRNLAGRYHLPLATPATPDILASLLAEPAGFNFAKAAAMLDWPTAVAALGASVARQREDFEAEFRDELARVEAARDHDPETELLFDRPVRAGRMDKKRHNIARDRGGQENASGLIRGDPKWILARECYGELVLYRPVTEITGSRGGLFHRFVLWVYAYATGEHRGEDYDAGLARHVQAASQICRAYHDINARIGHADPFAPLTELEHRRRTSLELALPSGKVPAWLRRKSRD